jgi:hypothetical protein
LPRIEIVGSLSPGYARLPGKCRTTGVRIGVAVLCVLAYVLTGCSEAHYGMTSCPAATAIGRAAKATDLKLLPGSTASGSTRPIELTCNYVPADQYQRWLHGFRHALSVEIYVFAKKIATKRLLGTVDGHAALQTGKAIVTGHITLAGQQAPVTSFRSGYGAWTGQWLPDGSYSALAIYLSAGQAPRSAAEFQNELQTLAQVSGLQ